MDLPPLDEDLDPAQVIAALAPVLGDSRCARLDAAAAGRLRGVAAVIEDLLDPHNYGAVLRSCEAMGVSHVYTINARHRFRTSPRVTQGCERWLEVQRFTGVEEGIAAARSAGYRVLAAVPGAADAIDALDVRRPCALAFGNEHLGLSPRLRALADGEFAIPMYGLSGSLNVSVTVAVALHAVTSALRRSLGRAGDLSPAEVLALRARLYAADVRGHRGLVDRWRRDHGFA